MAQQNVLRVDGYREFMRACSRADKETKSYVRGALRQVGEVVRADAVTRFSSIDSRSAAGYRASVTQRGVAIYQRLRTTTGRRPDYGALQMTRALLPARAANSEETKRAFERAIDDVCDHFERT